MKNLLSSFLIVTFSITLLSIDSYAIPSFARKYKTSCVTCHATYPKLTPFGEAFRINGYQFPEDDEAQVKEEPIPMGSESYKRVWPDAVWPNSIPETFPLSLRGRMGFTSKSVDGKIVSEFGLPTVQIMMSGTLGEDITFYVGAHLFEEGELGSLDRFYLKLDNMFTNFLPEHFLYLKIGQFIPEMVTFASNHRGLTNTAYAFNTYAPSQGLSFQPEHGHGEGPFGIETFQLGAEASGIVKSRLRYVIGAVNGNGVAMDNNSFKDFYGRLSYKFGGIAFDGSGTGEPSGYETSFTFGVLGYKGRNTENNSNFDFYRIGADFNLYLSQLNIYGGIIGGEDGLNRTTYNLFFAETNYAFYPWLKGIVRYEQANLENDKTIKRIIPNISVLYVANIKFLVESIINPDNFEFDNLFIGMDFAF